MAPQSYRLVVRTGPNPGKVYELNKAEMSLGRDIGNDIIVNDAEVSRRHARLAQQQGGYVLEDNGSTNGTFVNGQRLMGPHLLRPGETIFLGENVSLGFEGVDFDPDATVPGAYSAPSMPATQPAQPREAYAPPTRQAPPPPPPEAYAPPARPQEPYPQAPRPTETYPQPVQPREAYGQPAAQVYPAPPPAYGGQTPPGPVEAYLPPEEEEPRRFNWNLLLGGCGVLLLVACVALVAFLFWVDKGGTARWCEYLGFLFGSYCP